MLGKLIKYDLKSMNRFLILIHAFLIAASLFIRFFLTGRILSAETVWNDSLFNLPLALAIILYVLLIAGVGFATFLIIIVRFYKNLFSDQGYLTHTLPVTSGQHLLSKTISGSIWGCIDAVFIFLSLYIVTATPYVREILQENKAEIRAELGFTGAYANVSWGTVIAIFVLFSLLGVVSNVVMYYASVVIGQLVPGHKILGAIAAYFVLTTVISVLSLLMMALTGLFGVAMSSPNEFNTIGYFMKSLKLSGILSTLTTVILYVVTYWIMKKKINLE